MGFFKKPKISASSATESTPVHTPPPVVSETVEDDATNNYDQKKANRRGLLSTILSNQNKGNALAPQTGGNSTLG